MKLLKLLKKVLRKKNCYLLCYEPAYSDVLMKKYGSCPNQVMVFTALEKARKKLKVFEENRKLAFIALGEEVNGVICPGGIIEEV